MAKKQEQEAEVETNGHRKPGRKPKQLHVIIRSHRNRCEIHGLYDNSTRAVRELQAHTDGFDFVQGEDADTSALFRGTGRDGFAWSLHKLPEVTE